MFLRKQLKPKSLCSSRRDRLAKILNTFRMSDRFSTEFCTVFDFYIESFDNLFELQGKIGLDMPSLSCLRDLDQNIVKGYLFLVESSNTTAIGALRLFASNIYSDAYSLVRILYEIQCLLRWGNFSSENKQELYHTIYKSGLSGKDQYRNEWKLIKKSTE